MPTYDIQTFRSLFSGRQDAYGLETPTGPITVREPLTDVLISDHLKGLRRIGAFLIGKHNKVISACIDIDREDKKLVELIVATLVDSGFFPYIERSKSKGYHVWVFFDETIEAANIRKVLSWIMKQAGIDGIEIFPKQDSIDSNNGLGNYVFLPLHGQSVKKGGTVFVNLQFNPYENQWQHLSKIHRTKSENILSVAQEIPEEAKVNWSIGSDTSTPPRGVKVCYWNALNEGVEVKNPGRHVWAIRISKYLQRDQGLSPDIARAALIEWNRKNKPPLTENELNVDRTVADGLKYDWGCNDEVLKSTCSPECKYYKLPELKETNQSLFLLRPSTVKNLPPTEPLFEGYPLELRHLNVLVGAPGDLKTLTTYEYTRAVLTGQPLYGKYPCMKKGAVLIIDEDNPGDIVQERFKRFGFTSDDLPLFLSHMVGFLIDNPSWFERLKATVNQIKPVLIIVDCFSLIHKQKENQSDEIMRVMKKFRQIANLGPCIVFVHHLTKDKENPSARGSGGIIGAVENEIWNIKKGEVGILQFTKKTRQRPLDSIELVVKGFEDETDQAPISIKYQGTEIQILLNHIIDALKDEVEPLARSSGIEEADTIEKRQKDKQVSFTDAKLKKAVELGVKSKLLKEGKATLIRADGKPFRTKGYLLCSPS